MAELEGGESFSTPGKKDWAIREAFLRRNMGRGLGEFGCPTVLQHYCLARTFGGGGEIFLQDNLRAL